MSESRIALAQNLDLLAAAPLKAELSACAGEPVILDASGVGKLGAQCLQVLLAAEVKWRAEGVRFTVANPSDAMCEHLRVMGAASLLEEESMEEVCS